MEHKVSNQSVIVSLLVYTTHVYNELNLFHYIGESNSNERVEEEGETGGQPLHEKGNEESKDHEEATAPTPCTEISSDFNSEYINTVNNYDYIFVYR